MNDLSPSTYQLVGTWFGSKKQLQVISVNRDYKNTFLNVHCTICAKDKELYGDAIYKITPQRVRNNSEPCGCSRNYKYDENQARIRVRRLAESFGVVFKDFKGVFKGSRSRVILECREGHTWTKWYANMSQGAGCILCSQKACGLKLQKERTNFLIEKFKSSGHYTEGTVFRRTDRANVWMLHCPDCCTEGQEFLAHLSSLNRGSKTCLCKPKTGFDKSKPSVFYVLKIRSDKQCFTGFGVTGDFKTRIKTHKSELSKKNFLIDEYCVFNITGEQALFLEGTTKKSFPIFSQEVKGFVIEATYEHMYNEVIKMCEHKILDWYSDDHLLLDKIKCTSSSDSPALFKVRTNSNRSLDCGLDLI